MSPQPEPRPYRQPVLETGWGRDYSYTGQYAGGRRARLHRTLGVALMAAGIGTLTGIMLAEWLRGISDAAFTVGIVTGGVLQSVGFAVGRRRGRRRPR